MTLIGDIGGFVSAILIIPTLIVKFYNAKMYLASIYKELPVKDLAEKGSCKMIFPIGHKLGDKDIVNITEEAKMMKKPTTSLFRGFNGFLKSLFKKKDRAERRLREKVVQDFEKQLDIRSLYNVQQSLAVLIDLLFSKEQTVLF